MRVIPLAHDFAGETVLVFGGGRVGARKARRFAREARVVVVSPEFPGEFGDTGVRGPFDPGSEEVDAPASPGADPGILLVRDAPAPDSAAAWVERCDPALVVAATDDEAVNAAAATAASDRGGLVNRADRAGGDRPRGSVVVPATVRDDPVTVAVSTGGASPALSKHLRERIEDEIEGAGAMADLTADVRAELKDRGVDPGERRAAVRDIVRSSRVWKALRTGTDKARREADRVIRNTERGDPRT